MTRMGSLWGIAGWVLLAASSAAAQDAPPSATVSPPFDPALSSNVAPGAVTTLNEALALAYEREPGLLSERSNVRAADERLVQSRAAFGPSLTANGSYAYSSRLFRSFGERSGDIQRGFSGTASLILSLPVFTSGRLSAGVQASLAQIDFQRETLRFVEQSALLDVITSYANVRRDRELLNIANDNLNLLDRQFSESDTRFKVREITRTDLDQVVTRVELGRATVQASRSALGTSNSQFVRTVGSLAGDLQPLPPLPNLPATLEDAHAAAETGNPLILAARARERASRAQVAQVRGQLGPDVSLRGQATYGDVDENGLERQQRELRGEVLVQMPLYTSGQLNAQVREAKATNDADWRLIDGAVRDTRFTVDQAWNQLVSTRASLTNLENSVAAAQRAYDGATIQLRSGARTTLDVLDLARDLLDARSQLIAARTVEYLAGANLLSAMGRLEMRDLDPSVRRFDPEAERPKSQRRGETPIITDVPRALDSLVAGDTSKTRATRDAGADQAPTPIGAMPPPPAQTGP